MWERGKKAQHFKLRLNASFKVAAGGGCSLTVEGESSISSSVALQYRVEVKQNKTMLYSRLCQPHMLKKRDGESICLLKIKNVF